MDEDLRDRFKVPRRDYTAPQPRYRPPRTEPAPATHQPPSGHHASSRHQTVPSQPMFPLAAEQPAPRPAPHHYHRTKRHSFRKWLIAILILGVLGGGAAAVYFYKFNKSASPIPASEVNKATFPVYYPTTLPLGYLYKPGSATSQSGLLLFKITSGSKIIAFTEQAAPAKPLDLSLLKGFNRIDAPVGSAALGSSLGQPVAIVSTRTTLVNLSTSGGASQDELRNLIFTLAPINNMK